jgi:uncharacterized damage-inducible protein DinB
MRKQLTILALGALTAGPLAAQQAGTNDVPAAMRAGFAELNGWMTRAAELVPAEQYNYRPAATVRTFGQLIGHLADSHNYYCARGAGRNVGWSDAIEKGPADKATMVRQLRASIDACTVVYAGTGNFGPLLGNVSHSSIHYGNIVTYLRMIGLVPPSS